MQRCEDNVAARLNGNALQPLSGVQVVVTDNATGLPAALYSDDGVTPLPQPLVTDDNGYYGFYAANGEYTLTFSGVRIMTFTRKVVLADPSDNPYASKAELAAGSGASLVTFAQAGTVPLISVKQALDILYYGVKNPMHPQYAGGATGDGVANDYAALAACYADPSSPFVSIPAGKTFFVNSTVAVSSGTITVGNGTVKGNGTVGLFSCTYPSVGTTFDGPTLDGAKTSGTTDVVTLIYAPGSTATPAVKSARLTVRNCTLKNGSAGIAFENALDCNVHGNHISAMYRHTVGPYAGSYGYGVVFNGCQRSSIHDNPAIGTTEAPIERHGIYLPVFLDSQSAPTFTNFASQVTIRGNRVEVRHDPANEPYSSCIEAWNYFDIAIIGNLLIGGVRGINATPEYQNGGRVQIVGNLIKDSEIGIRNDRATKGAAPGTYYFEHYEIVGNQIVPLASVAAHQAVFVQGIKKVIFDGNYCKGNASTSFAFGYYDVTYNNITADIISATGNVISGFAQGFYLANVTKFVDSSSFSAFTGAPLPYARVAAIGSSEMRPKLSPFTALYAYNTGDWAGVTYYEGAIEKEIHHNGVFWVDSKGLRVRGPTANRPLNIAPSGAAGMFSGMEYGFRYYDESAGVMLYWNGVTWATSQQPAIPLGDTTANLNTFKTTYPSALNYGAQSYNTTTNKPVFYNGSSGNWIYADGTAI